jgi:hypothetical protein
MKSVNNVVYVQLSTFIDLRNFDGSGYGATIDFSGLIPLATMKLSKISIACLMTDKWPT